MKTFIKNTIIAVLAVLVFLTPAFSFVSNRLSFVHAQAPDAQSPFEDGNAIADLNPTPENNLASPTPTTASGPATSKKPELKKETPASCDQSYVLCNMIKFATWLAYGFFTLCSLFTIISGMIMNLTVELSISKMSEVLPGEIVNTIWVIFRDLANTVFLFALIYGSIQIILGRGGSSVKKLIINVVIAAVIVNFSLFATKVAIDFSNIISLAVYNEVMTMDLSKTKKTKSTQDIVKEAKIYDEKANGSDSIEDIAVALGGGMSGKYIQALDVLKLATNVESLGSGSNSENGFDLLQLPFRLIFNGLLLLIAGAMMFAVSLVFILRFVVIVFLMIVSPIAFIGGVLPQIKSQVTDKWLNHLTNLMFFPPLFFLLIYISLKVISSLKLVEMHVQGVGTNSLLSSMLYTLNIAFTMIISGMFLTIPLIAASVYSVKGGDFMKSFTDKVSGGIKSYTGSRSLGWAGSKANKFMGNTRIGNSSLGRFVNDGTFKKLADAKFGGGSNYADYQKQGLDIDKKSKQIKDKNDFVAKARGHENDLTTIDKARETIEKADREIIEAEKIINDPSKTQAEKDAANEKLRVAKENKQDANQAKAEPQARVQAVKDYVDGLSNDELKDMKNTFERSPALAQHLSDSKLTAMAKDPELENTAGKIYDERLAKIRDAIKDKRWDDAVKEAKSLSAVTISKLSMADKMTLAENAGAIFKPKVYDEITKEMTVGNKKDFDDAWSYHFISNPDKIRDLSPETVSKLSDNALSNDGVIGQLTKSHLVKISTAERSEVVLRAIMKKIEGKGGAIGEYLSKGAGAEFWKPFSNIYNSSGTASGSTAGSPSPRPRARIGRRPGVRGTR